MEPKDRQHHTQEGRVMAKVLPIERRVTKDISKEPEMKELESMIQTGELDTGRTFDYLKEGEDMGKAKDQNIKPYTIRLPEDLHRKLKMKAARDGVTMNEIIQNLIREHVKGMKG